ncbi:protoporphyrinogen oxidase [Actinotalea solisilvae]|uniref:protoporphyrinogen oxidase n=1 Tax=Actinotalea solisilvae TaxID=2072922 RepID=UPI0018F1A585|nr:protoporphyrinogen oxidase [Actinotalea solisilvae]
MTPAPGTPGPAGDAGRADVVVVGGGVAGLVVARACARAGRRVVLLEASERLGGCLASAEVAGLVLDAGAESFATRSPAVPDLLAELGLADDVVLPAPRSAWLQLPGRALPLPRTGVLGIPGDPWAADVRRAVGLVGALRASLDRVLPARSGPARRGGASAPSLGAVVRHRMGRRVLDRLVAPVVGGVHSAHPDDVDLDAVLPGLLERVERHGSLAAAVAAIRAAAPAGSAVAGIEGGMHRLVDALARDARAAGADVRTGARVTSVASAGGPGAPAAGAASAGGRWVVSTGDAFVTCDDVVVAAPGPVAVGLLRGLAPVDGLEAAADTGVALATLVIDTRALAEAPRGTGVLVARGAQGRRGVRAKALTHATAKWPWLAARAGGREVVRLSYGLVGGPAVPAGDALRAVATRDAAALLGVALDPVDVVGFARTDWPAGLPQARPGHRARVAAVRAGLAVHPGLHACGAWLAGTGLAAVVADAGTVADGVLGRIPE